MSIEQSPRLGLKENLGQFSLLVLVNAFVGAMVGLERSILPELAEAEFGIASKTAILSFITAFGISKAGANFFAGRLSNRFGRKNILITGWIFALPIPLLLMNAPNWSWIIFANVLLGVNQGLAWSSTVVMKIDLVGEKDRGLAMGLNEFAGYLAVGLAAFATGFIAERYGLIPYPFYMGIGVAAVGLILSLLFVRDTTHFAHGEATTDSTKALKNVFVETTLKNKTLSSVTQAGLINNLNDGMIWGLFPLLLIGFGFNTAQIGTLVAIYPAVWGIGQLFTGKLGDHFPKKPILFWGMLIQGLVILSIPFSSSFVVLSILSGLLGLGTALVYPNFLSTIANNVNPMQRAESVGTFRLWRDLGYAIGAVLSGLLADLYGLLAAVISIGILTILSALTIAVRMRKSA